MPIYYHALDEVGAYPVTHPLFPNCRYVEREVSVLRDPTFRYTTSTRLEYVVQGHHERYLARVLSVGDTYVRIAVLLPMSERDLFLPQGLALLTYAAYSRLLPPLTPPLNFNPLPQQGGGRV